MPPWLALTISVLWFVAALGNLRTALRLIRDSRRNREAAAQLVQKAGEYAGDLLTQAALAALELTARGRQDLQARQ